MMGDYADDAWDPGDRWSWSDRTRYPPKNHTKSENAKVFSRFAEHNDAGFKVRDRVVHMPSGIAGIILTVSAKKICWKPDSRIKPGGIWSENEKFRYEI